MAISILTLGGDPVASTTPRGLPAWGPRSALGTDLILKLRHYPSYAAAVRPNFHLVLQRDNSTRLSKAAIATGRPPKLRVLHARFGRAHSARLHSRVRAHGAETSRPMRPRQDRIPSAHFQAAN